MNGFGAFVIICTLLYCGISWVVPRVLAWLCKRRFHVEVRVGRIALPSLKLRDVSVRSSGFSVHVDEIGLRSSVFGGDESKLLAVVVRDVRINRDISGGGGSGGGGGAGGAGGTRGRKGLPPDLRGARVPPALLSLAQFMALHVQGATAMLLHARAPAPWLVHAAAAELRLDGSVVQGARALLVSAALRGASAKLLRHVPDAHAAAGPARAAPAPGHAPMPAAAPAPRARARARNAAAAAGRGQGDRAAQRGRRGGGGGRGRVPGRGGAGPGAGGDAVGARPALGGAPLRRHGAHARRGARGPVRLPGRRRPRQARRRQGGARRGGGAGRGAADGGAGRRRLRGGPAPTRAHPAQELAGARAGDGADGRARRRPPRTGGHAAPPAAQLAVPAGGARGGPGLGPGAGLVAGAWAGTPDRALTPATPAAAAAPALRLARPSRRTARRAAAAAAVRQRAARGAERALRPRSCRSATQQALAQQQAGGRRAERVRGAGGAVGSVRPRRPARVAGGAPAFWRAAWPRAPSRPSRGPPTLVPLARARAPGPPAWTPPGARVRGGVVGGRAGAAAFRGGGGADDGGRRRRLRRGGRVRATALRVAAVRAGQAGAGAGGGRALGGRAAAGAAGLRARRGGAGGGRDGRAGPRPRPLPHVGSAAHARLAAGAPAQGGGPAGGVGGRATVGVGRRAARGVEPRAGVGGAVGAAVPRGLSRLAAAAPVPVPGFVTDLARADRARARSQGRARRVARGLPRDGVARQRQRLLLGRCPRPRPRHRPRCQGVRGGARGHGVAGARGRARERGGRGRQGAGAGAGPSRGLRLPARRRRRRGRGARAPPAPHRARALGLAPRPAPAAAARRRRGEPLGDGCRVAWSCALHLRLLALMRELRAFRAALPPSFRPPSTPIPAPSAKRAPWTVNVRAQGRLSASACAGPRRPAATLTGQEVVLSTGPGEWALTSPALALAVDGAELFRASQLDVRRLRDSAEVRLERRNAEGFTLAWNERCWAVTLGSFKAVFPYQHRFAEVFQDELMSIVRWLRLTHRRPPTAAPREELLPPDLVIKIREFLFEMSDDPFEVRLRDNLELLEDECRESARRQKMLDAKVAELCKQHLLLPSGKVEELYASLSKKNAQIYVQRSQQMARSAPPRTRLFAWQMSAVEIVSLADPAVSTRAAAAAAAAAMDPDAPAPEGGLRFSTLWCRAVSAACAEWTFQLRDFPQPLLHIRGLRLWGRLAGAEQEAPPRARRTVVLHLGEPWGDAAVERTMTSLKFYHDLNCDVDLYSYAFGPCWEPVIAQCNLSFEKIVMPSRDPSVPLPFWDKMRLLLHGRLTMCVRQMTVLLHASLDPYNTTEEMELTWRDVAMDWTNAKVVFKGELNVYVRTASKYDDCRLLHLPNLRLTLKLQWVCLGDPNDHHSVFPCAPDKLPEYSSNQEHDSFRAFRSQNLNLSVALETKPLARSSNAAPAADLDCPVVLLYGSTLRWFENLKLILSGVTRPTRRGAVFGNVRPRKPQLSRHYRRLHLLLGLHRFQVCYWMSFAMQRGCEMLGGRISCSSEHTLTLVPVDDGLKHRPRADWAIAYMNCELNDAEIWLKSSLPEDPESGGAGGVGAGAGQPVHAAMRPPVEKCYCLSVAKVSYGREALLPAGGDTPTHRLVVYDLKGAWTKSNRDVAFALFDAFVKTKQLKKNLSTEALKGFRAEPSSTPKAARGRAAAAAAATDAGSLTPAPPGAAGAGAEVVAAAAASAAGVDAAKAAAAQATPSPMSKLQSGVAASMLQRLIAEADNKAVVFSDDPSAAPGDGAAEPQLLGRAACREDDALHKNWLIALVNSQVLLKGCETKGYVILSAAKAEILQRVHRPVWKARTPVSKTTWVGSLECMQYYATVAAGDADALNDNIMWLTVDNIQERGQDAAEHISELPDVPHLVGSGRSVGGVVSETVGATAVSGEGCAAPLQLQRIVSRCRCEFFYACYGESSVDPAAAAELPPPPPPYEEGSGAGPWERRDPAVDAFTLMHHDLEVCTNSLQYAMVLDVVNNLLLYVEPRRKEASARLQRMRFQLQLHSVEDQRRPIQQLQNKVRSMVSKLRRLERESYLLERAAAELDADINEEAYRQEMEDLDRQINECKEQLNAHSEELDMMISCYKETQLSANQKLATMRGDKPVTIVRANEIVFKHAQWRLTQADGQLGIADLVLSNFLYTKNSKSDDSGEHLLEVGYVRMTNLLPNQVYKEVLSPTEIQSNMPVDRKRAVRVFCREKAPVGGISVKEHFEINVVPITIGLTKKFFNTMLKFCFPERDPDTIEGEGSEDLETEGKSKKGKKAKGKEASFYVPIDPKDDVEKMKERAEKNKLFIYIKIPEVPVKVSYKGNKDKNLEDIRDFSLVIPTLEYHNVTWTWLDLLLAMKNDSRRVILSQAIKQKLQIKMHRAASDDSASPQEEDKARMLFGSRLMPGDGRSLKKGVFKLSK